MTPRPRNRKGIPRRAPTREKLPIVLIVCEGAKTEPYYFEALCLKWRLMGGDVETVDIHGHDCGNAPINVVDRAIELRKERKKRNKRDGTPLYDKVWCVFDKDSHSSFDQACDKARRAGLVPACSDPCFEFWYLLHFEHTSSQFPDCSSVIVRLRKHIPDYSKNKVPFADIEAGLDDAIKRAESLRNGVIKSPYTDVDKLVVYLKSMKRY